MSEVQPSRRMRDLGVVQHGTGILVEPADALRPARRAGRRDGRPRPAVPGGGPHRPGTRLLRQGHGTRAPQIGIGRAAATVRPAEPGARPIVLLNPRITAACDEMDEQ
ncbi:MULTISPECIES: hypothetical protein [unclassified Streptomyces]|uniref:hypothetical protein n=1 Tax=unclassified Streptomyces TaxID=2593676 RepID=UPI002DD9CB2A|nr:hypothetical protein [Streptomyces sp. NBC_01775]WSB81040.1 hypothetical protein OHB04_38645 [Streptomyces sp. NBC_01775]WSS39446.1 hypothetical protein OG220_01645 [Streptomyces sp. NBC_01187]